MTPAFNSLAHGALIALSSLWGIAFNHGDELLKSTLLLILILTSLACSNVNLKGAPVELASLDPEATFCVRPPSELGKTLNILFIIDTSGSNVVSSTDPDKARRIGAMRSIFDLNRANKYINWGLEIFGGSVPNGARHLVNTVDGQNFSNANDFDVALAEFESVEDSNSTPYVAALNTGRNAIERFISYNNDLGNDTGSYHVIFISDGVPAPAAENTDAEIFSIVDLLMDQTEAKINLSTVYYNVGGPNADAQIRLEEMANKGNGRYQDASNGEEIDLSEFIIAGLYKEPYEIKDFFVYNLNSAICDDGRMNVDSDADGLCDDDEIEYNYKYDGLIKAKYPNRSFSATKRYSFDPRFSDMIILKHLIDEQSLPDCPFDLPDYEKDFDYDLMNACEERFLYSKAVSGPNAKWETVMNDYQNRTSEKNFDSDGDSVIDGLEFLFFKNKSMAMDYNNLNTRINGLERYSYFKDHISYLNPGSSPKYDLKVEWIRKNEERQNCYRIDQAALPVYPSKLLTSHDTNGNIDLVHNSDENVVMVYYIMVTENNPSGRGVMRFSYQKLRYQQGDKINYNDTRFDEIEAK